MKNKIYQTEMKNVRLLIDSELSISNQLKVIKSVKERLDFCKQAGLEIKQTKLEI